MSALRDVLLWGAALAIAAVVLVRLRRGRRTLLVGRFSPRLVRMIAVVLVAAGAGDAEAAEGDACATLPAPDAPPAGRAVDVKRAGELPAGLEAPGPALTAFARARVGRGAWARAKQAMEALATAQGDARAAARRDADMALSLLDAGGIASPPHNAMARAWGEHLDAKSPEAPKALLALLDATEAAHTWDGWVVGTLFRASGPAASGDLTAAQGAALAELYGRLERHARVDAAYELARFVTGPVEQRPWMSKAAPPKGMRDLLEIPPKLGAELKAAYPRAAAGAWRSESALRLAVKSAGGALLRRGERLPLSAGAVVDLGRLDVLVAGRESPLLLEHPELGTLTLPPDRAATAWNLTTTLTPTARAKLEAWTKAAADCDEQAQRHLRRTLPASHAAIREALASSPPQKGAPALRLLLALFER